MAHVNLFEAALRNENFVQQTLPGKTICSPFNRLVQPTFAPSKTLTSLRPQDLYNGNGLPFVDVNGNSSSIDPYMHSPVRPGYMSPVKLHHGSVSSAYKGSISLVSELYDSPVKASVQYGSPVHNDYSSSITPVKSEPAYNHSIQRLNNPHNLQLSCKSSLVHSSHSGHPISPRLGSPSHRSLPASPIQNLAPQHSPHISSPLAAGFTRIENSPAKNLKVKSRKRLDSSSDFSIQAKKPHILAYKDVCTIGGILFTPDSDWCDPNETPVVNYNIPSPRTPTFQLDQNQNICYTPQFSDKAVDPHVKMEKREDFDDIDVSDVVDGDLDFTVANVQLGNLSSVRQKIPYSNNTTISDTSMLNSGIDVQELTFGDIDTIGMDDVTSRNTRLNHVTPSVDIIETRDNAVSFLLNENEDSTNDFIIDTDESSNLSNVNVTDVGNDILDVDSLIHDGDVNITLSSWDEEQSEEECCEYSCTACEKTFRRRSALTFHESLHTTPDNDKKNNRDFDTVTNETRSESPVLIFKKERSYCCEFCGTHFPSLKSRADHLINCEKAANSVPLEYIGSAPDGRLKCAICNKIFNHKSTLRTHIRVHTGEKPCKCRFCGNYYRDHSTLSKHYRVHTHEKPYKCPRCNRSFSQSGNMRRHILHVHKIQLPPAVESERKQRDVKPSTASNEDITDSGEKVII